MAIKQDFAELRYKGRVIKFNILYDDQTEDIIPLFELHDLISIRHNNRNKKAYIKTKVNPKTGVEEIYLSSFIDNPIIPKKETNAKNKRTGR